MVWGFVRKQERGRGVLKQERGGLGVGEETDAGAA